MKLIELIRYKDGGYFYDKGSTCENYGMEILADWFLYDVGSRNSQSWNRWVNDESEAAEATECNATWLEKYKDEIIFGSITDMIDSKGPLFEPADYQMISVSKENVIEMLEIWGQLSKIRPPQIMITEENGVFKMFEVQ